MPLPLSKVKRFSDYDGLLWLCVECRCCGHSRAIPAEFFAVLRAPLRASRARRPDGSVPDLRALQGEAMPMRGQGFHHPRRDEAMKLREGELPYTVLVARSCWLPAV
jgi:hypothetical protein